MSLVAQISAVVTQIGTKLKGLDGRVGSLEAAASEPDVLLNNDLSQATTSYTLVPSDAGKRVRTFSDSTVTVTINSWELPTGSTGLIQQRGLGQVVLVGGLFAPDGRVTALVLGGETAKSAHGGSTLSWVADSDSEATISGETALP